MIRTISTALALTALGVTLHGCGQSQVVPSDSVVARRPNIVMILADDLGYSDLGAMGSEIQTPNLDALVATGQLLTNYRTSASCSPTRSMLMSGTDHHQAGLGAMAENIGIAMGGDVAPWGAKHKYRSGKPPRGYEGYLNEHVHYLPDLLGDGGYHTYMVGKWHIGFEAADPAENSGRPFRPRPSAFPRARGFERSFALLQGGGSHFARVPGKPTIADLGADYVEDDKPVTLPPGFYSSTSFTDKLIGYIDADKADGKPFFAYLAYTAPHWPLHAPDEDLARVKGRYDAGYEVIRARRIEKMKALRLLPKDFQPNPGLDDQLGRPRWADLSPEKRAMEARKMEVYAAMVENMDRNIGRLVKHLKENGSYDNTMFVFASDNGAEGGVNIFPDNANTDNSLGNIGRPRSNVTYGERWAEVSATPFRLWKGYQAEGGISSPLIVRLPGQSHGKPVSTDLVHVTDLVPTFLEAANVATPEATHKGRRGVLPLSGQSQLARLQGRQRDPVRGPNDVLAGELFGSRYVIRGPWKLVSVPEPFGANAWELYDLSRDRGETTDLSATRPEIKAELARAYEVYAVRVGVVDTPSGKRRAAAP